MGTRRRGHCTVQVPGVKEFRLFGFKVPNNAKIQKRMMVEGRKGEKGERKEEERKKGGGRE